MAALALALAIVGLAGACMATLGALAVRRRVGPPDADLLDGAVALLALLFGSALGLAVGQAWVHAGSAFSSTEPPFPVLLCSIAGGAALGVVAARMRVDWTALGLRACSWRWVLTGLVAVVPVLLFASAWTSGLDWLLGVPTPEQELALLLREAWGTPLGWAGIAYATLGAPFAEEVLFRGLVVPAAERSAGRKAAIFGTAAVFAGFHLSDPHALPPLFLLGVVLAELRVRSGSLWPALTLHFANNAVAVLTML